MPRAVLLFSGALDSMLAARMLSEQGVEVEALFVETPWLCGNHAPQAAADRLGVPLVVATAGDEYAEGLRPIARYADKATRFCGQCHLDLARQARRRLEAIGADFVATGHVVGQRAANQKRIDFERYGVHSGLGDRLLWPLSAKHLIPTLPERQGWVDRQQLGAFAGRDRQALTALGRQWGLPLADSGQHGCPLGQTGEFGPRVLEHVRQGGGLERSTIALLRIGQHHDLELGTRLILGRRKEENEALERLWSAGAAGQSSLLRPANFPGPSGVLIGSPTPTALDLAVSHILRYAKRPRGIESELLLLDRAGIERRLREIIPADC